MARKPINEDELLDPEVFDKVFRNAAKDVAKKEARSLRRGTETWSKENKPSFFVVENNDEFWVVTNSEIWIMVNYGTKPHKIKARNAPYLNYPKEFTPKTRPGYVSSRQGGKNYSGTWVKAKEVSHPGVTPRRFDEKNLEKADQRFLDSLIKEIKKQL